MRSQARRMGRLSSGRSCGQSSRSRRGLTKRARSFRLPWLSTMLYRSSLGLSGGDVELAQSVPGQVDRQHDHPLPGPVQVIEPVR